MSPFEGCRSDTLTLVHVPVRTFNLRTAAVVCRRVDSESTTCRRYRLSVVRHKIDVFFKGNARELTSHARHRCCLQHRGSLLPQRVTSHPSKAVENIVLPLFSYCSSLLCIPGMCFTVVFCIDRSLQCCGELRVCTTPTTVNKASWEP